ncbi:MAG TPA: FAD-dependent oxidoreductase [Candidatus Hydrogenedentes bacterium]|nr:FAD-dependent oxidoreductase [Candidatus Hydrogenedentota bacterium]
MRNTRRQFIRDAVVTGTLAAAVGGGDACADRAAMREEETASSASYDVIVMGGGTAGAIAAIQAGRLGLHTLLVEKNGMPGGTTTIAAVNFPGLFHAWGRQIIAGIGWELVSRTVETCGDRLPDFSSPPKRHWQHQVRVNRAVYAAMACEALQQAKVRALFHAMPAQVEEREDSVHVMFCTKSGLETVSGKMLIDATGDANAVGLAGYPLVEGGARQPGTLILRLKGYDFEQLDRDNLRMAVTV